MSIQSVTLRCGHEQRVDLRGGASANLHLRDEMKWSRVCDDCKDAGFKSHDFPQPR